MKVLFAGFALAALAALAVSGCRAAPPVPAERDAAETARAEAPAPTIPLTIESASGTHRFAVEVARTAEEQRRGLMFRAALPPDGGMLFPFAAPRPASFWMRNTVIPLDMIFIRADGTISNIARETEPYSLDSYSSEGPVSAVLEIAGGRAAALGIEPGDRVSWDDTAAAGGDGALADAN